MVSPVSINKVNSTSIQQQFEQMLEATASKRKEVTAQTFPTARAFAREVPALASFNFSGIPVIKKTLDEVGKCFTGLVSLATRMLSDLTIPDESKLTTVLDEFRISKGDRRVLERLLLKKVPMTKIGYTNGLPVIPFNEFNPDTNNCLSSGDSTPGMLLKDSNGNAFEVEHNGSKGKLYWVTTKEGRYDVMQDLFGRLGPVGAPDRAQHKISRKLVRYEGYFFREAVERNRPQNVKTILENALSIEQLLKSGKEFNLREKWEDSIKETLFKSMVGDISPERMNFIIDRIDVGFRYLAETKALGPALRITIASKANQEGERAIQDLHLLGLDMMDERIEALQKNNNKPKDLLDAFALGAARLISEIPDNDPEKAEKAKKITFEASKIFFEMIGAGYFNRSNSRSNFDHIALTDPVFRQELVKALDQFKSTDLQGMIQEAIEDENLLKPFEAASRASLAYKPSVLFISRNSRVVFRSEKEEEKAVELTDDELKQLIKKDNLRHPLFEIPQNTEAAFPLGAYCREGLRRNGLLLEDGSLNSKEVFNPDKYEAVSKVGGWPFGTGVRGCIGETFSVETLKWEALCMAYLFKKFPGMRISGESKSDFNLFSGERFMVQAA